MKYKTNWPETKERLTALWEGGNKDRPCIAVLAPNGKKATVPPPVSGEQRWLDPDYNMRAMFAQYETTYYGGESLPGWILMAGWAVNTYGATPHFPMETIWFDHLKVDWDNPPALDLNWDDPYFKKVLALHQAVLKEADKDNFIVGQGVFMPGNDMLAFVIGTEETLVSMYERPEWTKNAILQLTRNWITFMKHFHNLSKETCDFWYGPAGWMTCWLPEPFVCTQSDISCMISPEMFDEFILPEMDLVGAEFKNVWYHLDGQGAFKHLPRLLSLPYMKIIQFVPEAGTPPNGPAHIELYKKIQDAGKIVHIYVPAENIEPLAKTLDPARLLIETNCNTPQEADELLEQAVRWTKSGNGGLSCK